MHYGYGDGEVEGVYWVGEGEVVCYDNIVGFVLCCNFDQVC